MIFILDLQDTQCNNITDFDNFLRVINTAVTQLGNVDQTFEITRDVQTRKGAETGQTSNFAFDQLANLQVFDLF